MQYHEKKDNVITALDSKKHDSDENEKEGNLLTHKLIDLINRRAEWWFMRAFV